MMVILEIPWGYICDRIGYKKTLIICNGLYFISKIVFYFAFDFKMFLLERILLAIVSSGISGCDIGYLYECCDEKNSTNHHHADDAVVVRQSKQTATGCGCRIEQCASRMDLRCSDLRSKHTSVHAGRDTHRLFRSSAPAEGAGGRSRHPGCHLHHPRA